MAKPVIEFFYDLSSPWTYLGFTGIQPLADKYGAVIDWRPILVGGVFNTVNKEVYEHRANPNPVRWDYMQKDLTDWANFYGIKIDWPSNHPVSSVKAMRGALVALEHGAIIEYSQAVFHAYWGALEDISDDTVLRRLVSGCGMDADAYFTKIAQQDVKDKLRSNTDELIARKGFGSPTMYLNKDDMFFGNDRLQLLERALQNLQK